MASSLSRPRASPLAPPSLTLAPHTNRVTTGSCNAPQNQTRLLVLRDHRIPAMQCMFAIVWKHEMNRAMTTGHSNGPCAPTLVGRQVCAPPRLGHIGAVASQNRVRARSDLRSLVNETELSRCGMTGEEYNDAPLASSRFSRAYAAT